MYSQDYGLPSGLVQLWELDCKEGGAPKNWCLWTLVLEKTLESPLTARRSNQSILRKSTLNTHWKDWCWSWSSSILVIWFEQLTHWKSPWCWERLRAEGEEGVRGWDGWMASMMQWTWTWANFGRRWETERPGMLQSMGSQRVRHNWATEQLQQPVSELGQLWMATYLSHAESSPVCMHMHPSHISKCSFLFSLFTGVTFSSTSCSLASNFSWRMGQLLKSESTQTTFRSSQDLSSLPGTGM